MRQGLKTTIRHFGTSSLALILLWVIIPSRALEAAEPGLETVPLSSDPPSSAPIKIFPSIYQTEWLRQAERLDQLQPYGVMSRKDHQEQQQELANNRSMLLNNDVLAFYGSPLSPRMGILGVYPKPALNALLSEWAEAYDKVNGDRGVIKAFYIIYGTVWPGGEIGILKDEVLIPWIEYALENDIIVYIDHQIGKHSVQEAVERLLPYLRYPNVHLAIDPEWRTLKPMQEIGWVSAAEVNMAQQMIQDYLVYHNLPGERQFVIHQFKPSMLRNRSQIQSDFARVRLVHCADGFGSPPLKRVSYNMNAEATNIPVKSFKLFFNSGVPGAGYDDPLMTPEEVMNLNPRPWIILYQ